MVGFSFYSCEVWDKWQNSTTQQGIFLRSQHFIWVFGYMKTPFWLFFTYNVEFIILMILLYFNPFQTHGPDPVINFQKAISLQKLILYRGIGLFIKILYTNWNWADIFLRSSRIREASCEIFMIFLKCISCVRKG